MHAHASYYIYVVCACSVQLVSPSHYIKLSLIRSGARTLYIQMYTRMMMSMWDIKRINSYIKQLLHDIIIFATIFLIFSHTRTLFLIFPFHKNLNLPTRHLRFAFDALSTLYLR